MILDEIIRHRRIQLRHEMNRCSLSRMKKMADRAVAARQPLSLADALKKDTLSCICEVKKASPSKGLIRPIFDPEEIAAEYQSAGANAISCLTEEYYFQGSSAYLSKIRSIVDIPILRKDFIFDEYQVYEAAALGADAILLIAAVLRLAEFDRLFDLARSLGLSVLGEMHTVEEMQEYALYRPDMVIGINNRNLKTFEVNLDTVSQLRPYAPDGAVVVSESGIKNNEDMKYVRSLGADAVLIGETLMRSDNITAELKKLRKDC